MFRRIEGACALLLLAAIVALVVVASVARAAGAPIIWSIEIAQLLFVWLCMLAADLALQESRHFGLAMVSDRLSPRGRRLLFLFNHAVLAALLGFLLVYAWRNMILMHSNLVGALQHPASWIHAAMVVGLALLLRTVLAQLRDAATGRDAEGAA